MLNEYIATNYNVLHQLTVDSSCSYSETLYEYVITHINDFMLQMSTLL